ncbi:hypothetical protein KEH51_25135 [[Brevibacterium] frigoritolerans]|uniref:Uncharacterized protein n=1 Tax=Peribacillus frigoritolerans TaxID=450367 RepID=A0A941FKY7_9BACI|nr:hypothetical protein [Peribacillus frigoritolerans]
MRDSCGSSGTGETHRRLRRGGSPPALRKASIWRGNQPQLTTWYIAIKYGKTAILKTFQLISGTCSLSADCLSSLLDANVSNQPPNLFKQKNCRQTR